MRASENPEATIPEDVLVTSARPDIVLVGVDEVTLIELRTSANENGILFHTTHAQEHSNLLIIIT